MWQKNVSLKEKTSFKIGGRAENFATASSEKELLALLKQLSKPKDEVLVFGSFTNVLLPDHDLPLVIQLLPSRQTPLPDSNGEVSLWAGDRVAKVAYDLLQHGWDLAEFASLPGSVGGAIWNNSHYGDNFFGDKLLSVRVLNQQDLTIKTLAKSELQLDYDHSIFHHQSLLITQVLLKLEHQEPKALQEKAKKASLKRCQTQPLGKPCAGCFWQNVPNNPNLQKLFPQFRKQKRISTGFLIDQAGLKGVSVGDAQVSEQHAAFIINRGKASQKDVLTLADLISQTIKEKFALELKKEVKVIY